MCKPSPTSSWEIHCNYVSRLGYSQSFKYQWLINIMFYPFRECAPSETFKVLVTGDHVFYISALIHSGFVCRRCTQQTTQCYNCSLCSTGFHVDDNKHFRTKTGSCQACPAGRLTFKSSHTRTCLIFGGQVPKSLL